MLPMALGYYRFSKDNINSRKYNKNTVKIKEKVCVRDVIC
jgi:hypothetical protein